ncbi:MAG: hypothetical protein WBJ84_11775, partial [Bacteroidales bacterium]
MVKGLFLGFVKYGSLNYSEWVVVLKNIPDFSLLVYNNIGGLKDVILFENISNLEFEINAEGGFGVGEIQFVKNNFFINYGDFIIIKLNNIVIYKGLIMTDFSDNNKILCLPFRSKLKNFLYKGDFTNTSIFTILKTIFVYFENQTGIYWKDSFINIDNVILSIGFDYEPLEDILKKLLEYLGDCYYYIDENNYLHIEKRDNIIKHYFFDWHNKKIKIEINSIKATRYKIFAKNDLEEFVYIGDVGSGGNYPVLDIEKKIGIKWEKFSISTVLSVSLAKEFAYKNLIQQAQPRITITIDDVNFKDFNNFKILDNCQVQKEFEFFKTIDDCTTLNNFTNAEIETMIKRLSYKNSIKLNQNGEFNYNVKCSKICLYVFCLTDIKLKFIYDDDTSFVYFQKTKTGWILLHIDIDSNKILKKIINFGSEAIYFDEIVAYTKYTEIFTNFINTIKYKINEKGLKIDLTIGKKEEEEGEE